MMLMWFSSRLPAFMRSRADPPPRYSMMIHSLVPCNTGVRGGAGTGAGLAGAGREQELQHLGVALGAGRTGGAWKGSRNLRIRRNLRSRRNLTSRRAGMTGEQGELQEQEDQSN